MSKKTHSHSLFLALVVMLGVTSQPARAQQMQFFRIYGPAPTKVLNLKSDGTMVWSNSLAGTNYTIQTATSLLGGGTNWVDYIRLPVATDVNTNSLFAYNLPAMAFIPAGMFTMGDTTDTNLYGDAAPTNITVSTFYMDVNLVSYSDWQAVYAYATNHGYNFVNAGASKGTNHPVQSIDWYDAVKWSNARSQRTGLMPAYYTDVGLTHVYTNGETDAIFVNWSANGYRLPTEAEWEKAARGGLSGQRFPWGDFISQNLANYYGKIIAYSYDLGPNGPNPIGAVGGDPDTSAVGSFAPNGYGLFDMSGNVMEWCWDWYASPYGQPTATNPTGSNSGSFRVLRGGGWDYFAEAARCGYRNYDSPSAFFTDYGFRCVRGAF